jgi:DNA-binding transcriptional regulator LsrR (DeoR family)
VTIHGPRGIYAELEKAIRARFDLKDAVVVDCERGEEPEILRSIGSAAAFYLQTTLKPNDVIGMAASGPTLVAVVDAIHPQADPTGVQIVQILGDFGNPAADEAGTHLVRRLAAILGGRATLLPAPALAPSPNARRLFVEDRFVHEAMHMIERVTLALVGVGNCDWSRAAIYFDDSSFPPHEMEMLVQLGAVGDICLHFFDISGAPVSTPADDRVIAITREQLQQVERVVCIAGGPRKVAAIRGALSGGWVDVLITDHFTAERLVHEQDTSE